MAGSTHERDGIGHKGPTEFGSYQSPLRPASEHVFFAAKSPSKILTRPLFASWWPPQGAAAANKLLLAAQTAALREVNMADQMGYLDENSSADDCCCCCSLIKS